MKEELSERARRLLGDVSDGSIQGDLTAALDMIDLLTSDVDSPQSELWRLRRLNASLERELTPALEKSEQQLAECRITDFERDVLYRIRKNTRTIGLLTSTLDEVTAACAVLEREGLVEVEGTIHVSPVYK